MLKIIEIGIFWNPLPAARVANPIHTLNVAIVAKWPIVTKFANLPIGQRENIIVRNENINSTYT